MRPISSELIYLRKYSAARKRYPPQYIIYCELPSCQLSACLHRTIRAECQGIIHDTSVTLEVLSVSLLLGDANGDSHVNGLDLTKVERIIVGLEAGSTALACISSPIANSTGGLVRRNGTIEANRRWVPKCKLPTR